MAVSEGSFSLRGGSPVPGASGDRARLLIAGDTHGNDAFISYLAERANHHDCAGVVQLGDFGFWPDQRTWRTERRVVLNDNWLTHVAGILSEHRLWMRVIDGNHDFHPGAAAAYPAGPDGVAPIRDGLLDWATRGSRWEWCGARFGALGGAASIDWRSRVPGLTWWPTEEVTDDEVAHLGNDPVDVLFTHDAPIGTVERHVHSGISPDLPSLRNRKKVQQARNNTRPALQVHGHFHTRYSARAQNPDGRVEGLAADIQWELGRPGQAWGILDLPSLDFNDGDQIEYQELFG